MTLKQRYTRSYHDLYEDTDKAAWIEGWFDFGRDNILFSDRNGPQAYWDGWNAAEAAAHEVWTDGDLYGAEGLSSYDSKVIADAYGVLSPYRLVCQHGEGFKRISLPVGVYHGTVAGFVIFASAMSSDIEIKMDRQANEYVFFEPASMMMQNSYQSTYSVEFCLVRIKASGAL